MNGGGRLTRVCRGSGPHGSRVIPVRRRRYAGRSGYVSTPIRQALPPGRSDALPCGQRPDPRHVCPFGVWEVTGGGGAAWAKLSGHFPHPRVYAGQRNARRVCPQCVRQTSCVERWAETRSAPRLPLLVCEWSWLMAVIGIGNRQSMGRDFTAKCAKNAKVFWVQGSGFGGDWPHKAQKAQKKRR